MIRKKKTHAVIGLHTEELATKILDYDFAVGKVSTRVWRNSRNAGPGDQHVYVTFVMPWQRKVARSPS